MLTDKTDVAVQTSMIFTRDAPAMTAEAGGPREVSETVRPAAPPVTARNWASRKLYVTPFGECFHLDLARVPDSRLGTETFRCNADAAALRAAPSGPGFCLKPVVFFNSG